MGAGIALECRLRYPKMYEKYKQLCDDNKFSIGMLWLYKSNYKWVLNFPTKNHWKYPSKKEYLHKGLQKFIKTYQSREIDSIAFPLLGADKGGINPSESLKLMKSYLDKLNINIEIYTYDRKAKDDMYDQVRDWLFDQSIEEISDLSNLRKDHVYKIIDALNRPDIVQLNQLGTVKGVGIKTLEKLFWTAQHFIHPNGDGSEKTIQLNLNFNDKDKNEE